MPFHITDELRSKLKDEGVDILIDTSPKDRDYLFLVPENPKLSTDEWKRIWALVAAALPTHISNLPSGNHSYRSRKDSDAKH